jgi:hypothetical protein
MRLFKVIFFRIYFIVINIPLILWHLIYWPFWNWTIKKQIASLDTTKPIVLVANGPAYLIDRDAIFNKRRSCNVAVMNNFGLSDDFELLKPDFYFMADKMYWASGVIQSVVNNRDKVFDVISKSSWPMTIIVPDDGYIEVKKRLTQFKNVSVIKVSINIAVVKDSFTSNFLVENGIAMPTMNNVLIFSIWCSIRANLRLVFIYGANFDSFKNLKVDQTTNTVISGNTHFYENEFISENKKFANVDSKSILKRFRQTYHGFLSLSSLASYAGKNNVIIYNKSSSSIIDVFQRN